MIRCGGVSDYALFARSSPPHQRLHWWRQGKAVAANRIDELAATASPAISSVGGKGACSSPPPRHLVLWRRFDGYIPAGSTVTLVAAVAAGASFARQRLLPAALSEYVMWTGPSDMKFITRELYNAMQCPPDTPESDAADARWESQFSAYRAHLESIRARLPPSMQAFCDTSLHDGVIKAATQPTPDSVQLEIDASHNPWGPIGYFHLKFTGAKDVSPLDDTVGEWWLYQEVHLHANAGFDYRVLLTEGEFCVVADNVELIETSFPDSMPT